MSATLNGKPVLTAYCGTSISKDPFLQFVVRGANPGGKIEVTWLDNRGDRRTDETTVA